MSATFNTCDVLSCSTGRLLGDMGGVYKVAEYMTGGPVWTHQLVIIGEPMRKALKLVHPDLPGPEDAEHVTQENYRECLNEWEGKLGKTFNLAPELAGCLANGDPLADIKKSRPDAEVVVVRT